MNTEWIVQNDQPIYVTLPYGSLQNSESIILGSNVYKIIKHDKEIFNIGEPSEAGTIFIQLSDCDKKNLNSNVESIPNVINEEIPKICENNSTKTSTPIKCQLCDKTFAKVSQYRLHMQDHKNTKKFKCTQCSESFNIESNFKIHLASHKNGSLECPICNRSFQRLASLKSHLLLHQVEETYSCNECLMEFSKEEHLKDHMEVHKDDQINSAEKNEKLPLVCSYCNHIFQDLTKYKEHILLHNKAKKLINSGKRTKRKKNTRNKTHKCDICTKTFSKLCLLERHRRVHTGEKPFTCHLCNRAFSQNGSLQIHLDKHEGKKPFQCLLCPSKFSQKSNLKTHIEKSHMISSPGDKVYKCSQCTCIFKKVSTLNGHVTKFHSGSSNDSNSEIASLIDQLKELDKQANPVRRKEDVTIPVINKETHEIPPNKNSTEIFVKMTDTSIDGTVRRYVFRQQQRGDTRWYICSYCIKEFKKPSDLIRHVRIHTKEKPFKCTDCGQCFAQKSTLTNHQTTHTGKDFECALCLQKFSMLRSLNIHLRKHDETAVARRTANYKCSVCEKAFFNVQDAEKHMSVHEVSYIIRPDNGNLKLNMKEPLIETEKGIQSLTPRVKIPYASMDQFKNRPFRCHVCTAAFTRGIHLNRHMLTHSGVKSFRCDICSKMFATKYALAEHIKIHTKTRNHECKFCNKRFFTNAVLKNHMLMHSSVKKYICPYCNNRFKRAVLCRKHIRTVHTKEKELDCTPVVESNNEDSVMENEISVEKEKDQTINEPNQNFVNFTISDSTLETPIIYNNDSDINLNISNLGVGSNYEEIVSNFNDINSTNPQIIAINNTANSDEPTIFYQLNPEELKGANQLMDVYNSNIIFAPSNINVSLGDNVNILDGNNVVNTTGKTIEDQTLDLNNLNIINPEEIRDQSKIKEPNIDFYNINLSHFIANENPVSLLTQKDYSCNLCKIKFKAFDDLKNHVCNNVIETPVEQKVTKSGQKNQFKCQYCRKKFLTNKSLMQHNAKAHANETVVSDKICSFCSKVFKKSYDLKRHVRIHTGEKPFPCEKCEKSFSLKSTLRTHYRTHDPVVIKDFKCYVCDAYFSCKSSLRIHTFIHTDTKPYSCDLCSTTFRTAHHKKNHMVSHQRNNRLTPKNNTVNLLENLVLESHNDLKKTRDEALNEVLPEEILLDEIQQATQNLIASDLTNSDNLDLGESLQLDPILLQFQSNNYNLELPYEFDIKAPECPDNTGIEIAKFQCDICLKLYATKDVLQKHKKNVHTKFQCDKCSKTFLTVELLEKHSRLHSGYRPFSCSICANSFAEEADLKVHLRRIHQVIKS